MKASDCEVKQLHLDTCNAASPFYAHSISLCSCTFLQALALCCACSSDTANATLWTMAIASLPTYKVQSEKLSGNLGVPLYNA